MRVQLITAALPLAANAFNIVMGNDDGWAEINIRTFYKSLTDAGENLILSGPAENKSGSGSSDSDPEVLKDACEFDSCPAGSPATGSNATDPRLNYVNSYPVTALKHGINDLAPKLFNGAAPDLAVTGPNVGNNIFLTAYISGTVGAAVYAAKNKIPSIAFSGKSGTATAWNAETPLYSKIYAELATNVTTTLLASGAPFLPEEVWLNVNFPAVTDSKCNSASQFKFVLSRIFPSVPLVTKDVETCGSSTLPWENSVIGTDGCYVSISIGDSNDKTDSTKEKQAVVLEKLGSILSCLPE